MDSRKIMYCRLCKQTTNHLITGSYKMDGYLWQNWQCPYCLQETSTGTPLNEPKQDGLF